MDPSPSPAPAGSADVAIVLEGTYPYAVGGVSTWVDGLIRNLPEVTFGVCHLYAGQRPTRPQFGRPRNVAWHLDLQLPGALDAIDPEALASRLPPCRVVHALSTGFAGLVGVALKRLQGSPLVVTEHGVYWHEIEQGAPELETGLRVLGEDVSGGNPCASRAGWVEWFKMAARQAFAGADVVTTVTAANLPLQAAVGFEQAVVIPNGVAPPDAIGPLDPYQLATLHESARLDASFRVVYLGRVTPLKDVHTVIRAFARLLTSVPGARLHLVGPTDDADYAASCQALADRLGVAACVHLTGTQASALWLRHADVVVLASRSEAEPLALLEAMGHGVPTVAPDVGGIRGLIGGPDPAGIVMALSARASPGAFEKLLAEALGRLAEDPGLRERLGAAGRRRVAGRTDAEVADRYRDLYVSLVARDT